MIKITCVFIVLCVAGMSFGADNRGFPRGFPAQSSKEKVVTLRDVASKAEKLNDKTNLLKAGSKNLGYTYAQYNSAPSYQKNMKESYSGSYNQDKYPAAASQYPSYAPYNGQYNAPEAYNGQYNGQYQAPGNYIDQYSNLDVLSTNYMYIVEANPGLIDLTPEKKLLIKVVKKAFAFKPLIYRKSADYKNTEVNPNFDYISYGDIEFRYFAPRLNIQYPNYKSESGYAPANTDTSYKSGSYNSAPYKSGSYNSASYKSDSYNSGPYKSDSYNSAPYKSDSYNSAPYKSGSYNSAPYKSGSYNSAPYKSDSATYVPSYKQGEYSSPGAYTSNSYKKGSSLYDSKQFDYINKPY